MAMVNDAYYGTPEQERCQAGYTGCQGTRNVRLHCEVEGADLMVCANCAQQWRINAQEHNTTNRCPRCEIWYPPPRVTTHDPLVDTVAQLTGPIADAVEAAMHMEQVPVDIRKKVLQRLQKDAPVLADSTISDIVQYSMAVPGTILDSSSVTLTHDGLQEFTDNWRIHWGRK